MVAEEVAVVSPRGTAFPGRPGIRRTGLQARPGIRRTGLQARPPTGLYITSEPRAGLETRSTFEPG